MTVVGNQGRMGRFERFRVGEYDSGGGLSENILAGNWI